MPGPASVVRFLAALVLGSLVLLSTAACGEETAPADRVPELATLLDQVDEAVAAGDDDAARRSLEDLIAATEDARDSGELDDAEADRIVSAADRVLEGLPEPPAEEPSPTEESPTAEETEPLPSPTEEEGGDDEEDQEKEKDKGKPEDKGKGKGKGKSKDD